MPGIVTISSAMFVPDFLRDGFAVVPNVLSALQSEAAAAAVGAIAADGPGTRCLLDQDWCRALAADMRAHPGIKAVLADDYVAVQCTYFEKSVGQNWLVPVHQDLSIPVHARVAHPGLRGWSEKEGSLFVQPPAALLERLVSVRIHLDPCLEPDGPLQFVPATHLLGRIDAVQARELRRTGPVVSCTVDRGAALLMRPLALHTSSKATGTSRRRVLHFVFGPPALPYGLQWRTSVRWMAGRESERRPR